LKIQLQLQSFFFLEPENDNAQTKTIKTCGLICISLGSCTCFNLLVSAPHHWSLQRILIKRLKYSLSLY